MSRVAWRAPLEADLAARLAGHRLCRPPFFGRFALEGGLGAACVADTAGGPALVITELAPVIDEAALRVRAAVQAASCALAAIPFGGGAAALVTPTPTASLGRAWADAISPHATRRIVGGPAELVGWMADAVEEPAALSNRPQVLGGLPERADALARGAFLAVQAFARRTQLRRGARVAFQGGGPAAEGLRALLEQAGYAVARTWAPPITEEPAPAPLAPDAPHADVVVVACPWGLHPGNVGAMRPGLLVELAPGGIAAELDEPLMEQAVPTLPAALVRAGEAVAAHLEWCAARGALPMDAEAVRNHLAAAMARVVRRVWDRAVSSGATARQAATALALTRLDAAHAARGRGG